MNGSIVNVSASYPTIVYHAKSLAESAKNPLLIFIPGNPGLVGYYIDYLSLLQKRFPTFEILAISHAGFTHNDAESDNEVIGLQAQADHKREIIAKFVSGPRDVYLMGHSVGCYIIQRMVLQMVKDNDPFLKQVKQFGFITPTINEIGLSLNGVVLSKCFQYIPKFHIVVSKLAYVTKLIPDSVMKWLLKWKLGTSSPYTLIESQRLVQSRNLIVKSLGLAKEEMLVINKDHSVNEIFFNSLIRNSTKLWSFFCHTDYWIHNDTRRNLIDTYSSDLTNFEVHDDIDIVHSFCINSSESFANITSRALIV